MNQETVKVIEEKFKHITVEYIRYVSIRELKWSFETVLSHPDILRSAGFFTQEDMDSLKKENEYLKAQFEANIDKVYSQEDMDKARAESWNFGKAFGQGQISKTKEQYISQFKQQQP